MMVMVRDRMRMMMMMTKAFGESLGQASGPDLVFKVADHSATLHIIFILSSPSSSYVLFHPYVSYVSSHPYLHRSIPRMVGFWRVRIGWQAIIIIIFVMIIVIIIIVIIIIIIVIVIIVIIAQVVTHTLYPAM